MHRPNQPAEQRSGFSLLAEFHAERAEILRHKWIESQKAGHDIGFEAALTDWIRHHRQGWAEEREDIERFEVHEAERGEQSH